MCDLARASDESAIIFSGRQFTNPNSEGVSDDESLSDFETQEYSVRALQSIKDSLK